MGRKANIEIVSKQKIEKINILALSKSLQKVFLFLDISSKKISVFLCDNNIIQNLNLKYFKKDNPTDVIAFPLGDERDPDYLGEVVVSVEEAKIVSKEMLSCWRKELFLYIVHGVLHLLGHGDTTRKEKVIMRKEENRIMSSFNDSFVF